MTPGGVSSITVFNLSTGSLGAAGDNNLSVTVLGGTGTITVLPNAVLSTGNNGNINIASGSTNNGDIFVNGSIFTFGTDNSNVNISARRSLTINRPIFSAAGTVTLSTANGDLITGTNAQISAGGAVTITSNLAGANPNTSANIVLNSGVQRFANTGAITIQSKQELSVGSIFNVNGNVSLRADKGTLLVRNSSLVQTLTGDINIQQRGLLATDLITFGSAVSVLALAPSNPLGNINVFVDPGAGPPPQQIGVAPALVQQITSAGGQIFFGGNFNPGISASGPLNTLSAKGANITFFTNAGSAAGSNAISLGGSNFFFADPPSSAGTSVSLLSVPPASAAIAPMAAPIANRSNPPAVATPSPQQVFDVFPGSPAASNETSLQSGLGNSRTLRGQVHPAFPGQNAPGGLEPGVTEPFGGRQPAHRVTTRAISRWLQSNNEAVKDSPGVLPPPSYTPRLTDVLTGFVSKKAGIPGGSPTYLRSAINTSVSQRERNLELVVGEILVSASRRSIINAGSFIVDVGAGAIVNVVKDGTVLKVRNLCDAAGKSVQVIASGKPINIGVGEELIVGCDSQQVDAAIKQDKIGRREVATCSLNRLHMIKSEFSIIGLIQKSDLLLSMYLKGSSADRAVMERVMKMAAALFQITGKRGAYSAYEPSKASFLADSRDSAVKIAESR